MELRGSQVYLRPLCLDDTDLILHWRSDPTVASQLFSDRPPTRAEHEQWFKTLQTRNDRLEFVIVLTINNQPIGTIGLSGIDFERTEAEFGILIGEPNWRGKRIAREASVLILKYAFAQLDLRRVVLNLFADNESARKLYEHLGFVEDFQLRSEREKNGLRRQMMTMFLDRERFRKGKDVFL